VVGGIYSPNHQNDRWWRLLSYGAPDSPVRHRTLSGAPATSPCCWVPTVGALTSGATGQSGGAPDSHCSLSGAPSDACSDLCTRIGAWSRCFAWCTRQSGATPDSPVNYSGAASRIPEGGKFRLELPGAPDTVRWHTR
jgi:hypothetical protein